MKKKIAITTDGSEVWVTEGSDIVNHQKEKDILDMMLDAIDNENLFKGVHKVDLSDITDEDLEVTNKNIKKRRKENENLYSKSVKFLKSKTKGNK
mgnify:CR=1 FL=1|tara:strand:+ start:378 stop:662 length:285 start_codon:yes stop_codon:yes gene_type:complete